MRMGAIMVMIVVVVIMIVTVKRQRPLGSCPEQRAVLRRIGHNLRRSFTADMPVEAQDAVGRGHHNVQIVAHHQDGAASRLVNGFDLLVKSCGSRLVQPLGRLV